MNKYVKSLLESKLAIQNVHVYVNEDIKQKIKNTTTKKETNLKNSEEEPPYTCFPMFIDPSDKNLRKP